MVFRPLDPKNDSAACDAIVASLPNWFGLEEGIRECAEAVRTQPGLVAEVDGEVSGFLTIARPYPQPRRSLGWRSMLEIVDGESAER